jgi:hypothetical protein
VGICMVFGSGFPDKLDQTFFLINEFSSSPANIQFFFAISCKLARHHSGDAERIRVETERVKLFRIF